MASIAEYVAQGFPYAVAYEKNANDRAELDFYESAVHKEMYANERAKAEGIWADDPVSGLSAVGAKEKDANARAQQVINPVTGKKFTSAAEQEAAANVQARSTPNPVTGKMFLSAADQEIDANRRARLNKYLNAADYESGVRTRSYEDFIDPRDEVWTGPPPQYHIDTANQYIWDETTGEPVYVGDNSVTSDGASANIKGAAGSMDLLSYRPGSQKYWDTYLPKNTGLMDMNLPPPEYSLAYAPGEWLAPKTWRDVIDAPGDQMRDIPQGAWRYATYKPSAYNAAGYPKQGISATEADLNMPGWPTRMP